MHSTYRYCDRHEIPYKKVGKLVVATDESELDRLEALYERAKQNNVPDMKLVGREEILKYEPHCTGNTRNILMSCM